MKKIILTVLVVMSSLAVQAQELKWETDINKAISVSNKTKKPMLLFFTGSDWCGWCIRLQKEVLKTPDFATWAKKNVVLVELDYPRSVPQSDAIKAQNAGLQQAFGIQGFPTVYFATAKQKNGKPSFTGIGSTGYVAGGPKAWLAEADKILKTK
ncbi:thioredoxin family protein [Flavobacterium nackdongense]|uniref:Thioredoxin family protein n=1 Tax=Flavobacterium nackdongense TaxID=2547394 RepID=A0A4P6Y813_9FLAO|nr:thioredoxin family protein [Flavobacterium nackdongense]QBN18901.1 thioredoxin family protein [Flavobacterium nackdongense]